MRVRLSKAARDYLIQETAYLRSRSVVAAKNFAHSMSIAQQNLQEHSSIGFDVEGLPIPGVRRLVLGNYLLDYEIQGSDVHVLTIQHGRQVRPELPYDDDADYEDVQG